MSQPRHPFTFTHLFLPLPTVPLAPPFDCFSSRSSWNGRVFWIVFRLPVCCFSRVHRFPALFSLAPYHVTLMWFITRVTSLLRHARLCSFYFINCIKFISRNHLSLNLTLVYFSSMFWIFTHFEQRYCGAFWPESTSTACHYIVNIYISLHNLL